MKTSVFFEMGNAAGSPAYEYIEEVGTLRTTLKLPISTITLHIKPDLSKHPSLLVLLHRGRTYNSKCIRVSDSSPPFEVVKIQVPRSH